LDKQQDIAKEKLMVSLNKVNAIEAEIDDLNEVNHPDVIIKQKQKIKNKIKYVENERKVLLKNIDEVKILIKKNLLIIDKYTKNERSYQKSSSTD
jgi:hypothetical protein